MRWRRFKPCLVMLSLASLGAMSHSLAASEGVVRVPVYNTARPPMVEIQDGKVGGILPDMFRAILDHAGLSYTVEPVPVMRKRILFEDGTYVLACCANPAWRNLPKERKMQLFSDAFTENRDIFVFAIGNQAKAEGVADLSQFAVGVRRGFDYWGSQFFGSRLDLESEEAIFRAVIAGHANVGIVNDHTFQASP